MPLVGVGEWGQFRELQPVRRDVIDVPLSDVERSAEFGCNSPPRPTAAKMACTDLLLYNAVPIAVPSVFVMRSVMPESRVGRKACNTSIVRLIAAPRRIVASTAWLRRCTDTRYAQKKNPRGTKPAMLIKTFFQ